MTLEQFVGGLLGTGGLTAIIVAVIGKLRPRIDQQAVAQGSMQIANEDLRQTLETQRAEMQALRVDMAAVRAEVATLNAEVATAKALGARAVAYIRDLHANWPRYRTQELPPAWVD